MVKQNRKTALVLIAFPAVIFALVLGIGTLMGTGFKRMMSTKDLSITAFAEAFNQELSSEGYSIQLKSAVWERISEGTCTLNASIQTPMGRDISCKMMVTSFEQPRMTLPILSMQMAETISVEEENNDSALKQPAYTVFELFTPDYVQQPDKAYAFGYSFNALWQRFTATMARESGDECIPFFPAPVQKNRPHRADTLTINIQSAEGVITRTLDWRWW